MARTALGTRPQPQTRTALFAYFAARLAGIPVRSFDPHFRAWGLAVRKDGALRAASQARLRTVGKSRPGRRGATTARPLATQPRDAFRDWLLIDESRLDVEIALITFPGSGKRQGELIDALSKTAGVRQLLETAERRSVTVIAVFVGLPERRALRSKLEELAEEMYWEDVLYESHEPAIGTWRFLAGNAAAKEGLL